MAEYFENTAAIDEWHQKRRSRFTSSENYKLLRTSRQKEDELWSAGSNTYIETKAIELCTAIWERPEIDEVKSLLHGKVYEYPAYEAYVVATRNTGMIYMGTDNPMFYPCQYMPEESGGTPDVADIADDGKINYLAEIKCPRNPAFHFQRLKWKSQWDIKEGYLSCYTQMQDLIRLTGAQGCHFISYDERQLIKSKKIVIIEVQPDQKFIDNLEIRIRLAVKEKYKILSSHLGVEVKNRKEFDELIKQ